MGGGGFESPVRGLSSGARGFPSSGFGAVTESERKRKAPAHAFGGAFSATRGSDRWMSEGLVLRLGPERLALTTYNPAHRRIQSYHIFMQQSIHIISYSMPNIHPETRKRKQII